MPSLVLPSPQHAPIFTSLITATAQLQHIVILLFPHACTEEQVHGDEYLSSAEQARRAAMLKQLTDADSA
mgnify:CR=1 FL=1